MVLLGYKNIAKSMRVVCVLGTFCFAFGMRVVCVLVRLFVFLTEI